MWVLTYFPPVFFVAMVIRPLYKTNGENKWTPVLIRLQGFNYRHHAAFSFLTFRSLPSLSSQSFHSDWHVTSNQKSTAPPTNHWRVRTFPSSTCSTAFSWIRLQFSTGWVCFFLFPKGAAFGGDLLNLPRLWSSSSKRTTLTAFSSFFFLADSVCSRTRELLLLFYLWVFLCLIHSVFPFWLIWTSWFSTEAFSTNPVFYFIINSVFVFGWTNPCLSIMRFCCFVNVVFMVLSFYKCMAGYSIF